MMPKEVRNQVVDQKRSCYPAMMNFRKTKEVKTQERKRVPRYTSPSAVPGYTDGCLLITLSFIHIGFSYYYAPIINGFKNV